MQRSLNTLLSNKPESHPLNIKDIVSYPRSNTSSQPLNTFDYYYDQYTNKIIFIVNTDIKICGKSLATVIKSVNIDNLFQCKEYSHNVQAKRICFIHSNSQYSFVLLCYEIYSEYYVNVVDVNMTTVIQRIKSVSDKSGFKGGFFVSNNDNMFCLVLSTKFIVLAIKQQLQQGQNVLAHEVVPVGKSVSFGSKFACDRFHYDHTSNLLIIISNERNESILVYDMSGENTWSTPHKINIPYNHISSYVFKQNKSKRNNSIGSNAFQSPFGTQSSFQIASDNSHNNTRNYSTSNVSVYPFHIYCEQIYKYKYIIILDLIQLKILLYRLEQISKIKLAYVILISDDAVLRTASYNSNEELCSAVNGVLHCIDNLIIFHNTTNELTYIYDIQQPAHEQQREELLIYKPFKVNVKHFYDNINNGNVVFINNVVVSMDEHVKSIMKFQFDCVKYFDFSSSDDRNIIDAVHVIFQRKNYKQCILHILKHSLLAHSESNSNNNIIAIRSKLKIVHCILETVSFKISSWNNGQNALSPSQLRHFKTKYLITQEEVYKLFSRSFKTNSSFDIHQQLGILFLFDHSLRTQNINLNSHFYSLIMTYLKSNPSCLHKFLFFFNANTFIPPSNSIIELLLAESKSSTHSPTMRKYFKQLAYDMLYNNKMYSRLFEELLSENNLTEAVMVLHIYKDDLAQHKEEIRSALKHMVSVRGNVTIKKLLLCLHNKINNYMHYDFN